MQLQSTLTCPKCSYQAVETMPTDACQFFHDCKGLWRTAQAPRGRLLRVLLLRLSAVPADTEQLALLRAKGSLMPRGPKGEKRPADAIGMAIMQPR